MVVTNAGCSARQPGCQRADGRNDTQARTMPFRGNSWRRAVRSRQRDIDADQSRCASTTQRRWRTPKSNQTRKCIGEGNTEICVLHAGDEDSLDYLGLDADVEIGAESKCGPGGHHIYPPISTSQRSTTLLALPGQPLGQEGFAAIKIKRRRFTQEPEIDLAVDRFGGKNG